MVLLCTFGLSCACASSAAQGPPASRRARPPARPFPSTTSGVMVTAETVLSDGMLNMMSVITFSSTPRRPRAPVLRSSADLRYLDRAPPAQSSARRRPSANMRLILLDERVLRLLQDAHERVLCPAYRARRYAGRRPISSGIRPYFIRSCGSICASRRSVCSSSLPLTSDAEAHALLDPCASG